MVLDVDWKVPSLNLNLRSSASKEITVTYSNYHETFRVDCFSDQFSTKIHPAPTKHRFTLMSQNLQGAGKTGPAKEPMVLSTIKMAGNPSLKFWCAGKPTGTSTSSSLSWMLGISAANHGCALQHLSLKAGIWVDDPPVAHLSASHIAWHKIGYPQTACFAIHVPIAIAIKMEFIIP